MRQFEEKIVKGDIEVGFSKSDVIVEGDYEMGGALHWYASPIVFVLLISESIYIRYLEPQSTYALPREDGGLTVHYTTQSPMVTQMDVRSNTQ